VSIRTQPSIETLLVKMEDWLGPRLVGAICGLDEKVTTETWAVQPLSSEMELQVRIGYTVFRAITETEGPDMARAWMIGMSPLLGDSSPIQEIGAGRGQEVLAAVRVYLEGSP
jgi:hypothetical protein